jgi:EmrB/QacA subfamily drug resistance transporter
MDVGRSTAKRQRAEFLSPESRAVLARRWTLVATIIASSMTFIDGTVVNVALPALQTGLNATITDVQWVIEAYALFLGALILVGGSLGDQLGRRKVFLAGVVVFTVSSVLCGLAPTSLVLIIGRAVQGIGAALLVPGSLAIISATFDGEERGRAIGTWSGFSAITTALGPVGGGWLIEHLSWRAVFFMNVPLAAIVIALSVRHVEESKDPSRTGAIDWAGAALAVLGLSGLVLGLLEWPPLGATHPLVVSSLVVGVASLVALPVVERRARNPMMPLSLFSSRPFTLANILTLLLYAALAVMLFLLPLLLIQVHRFSATAAGAALLPFPIIIFALSRWAGGLVTRVGSRLPLTIGPFIVAIGFALMALPGVATSFWETLFPGIVVVGLGMAVTVAPLTTTVMNSATREHSGVASGVNNAVSRIAGLIAIAVFGVVVAHVFSSRIAPRVEEMPLAADTRAAVDRELPKMAGADLNSVTRLTPTQRDELRAAIDASFTRAFRITMMGLAVLAVGAALVGSEIRGVKHS